MSVSFDDAVASRVDNGAFFAGNTKTPFLFTSTPGNSIDMTPAFGGLPANANTDNPAGVTKQHPEHFASATCSIPRPTSWQWTAMLMGSL